MTALYTRITVITSFVHMVRDLKYRLEAKVYQYREAKFNCSSIVQVSIYYVRLKAKGRGRHSRATTRKPARTAIQ